MMIRFSRPRRTGLNDANIGRMYKEVKSYLENERKGHLPNNSYTNPIGPTFREFAQFISERIKDDEHWAPYYDYCSLCHVTSDFVLRFENLEEDSNLFIKYHNLNITNIGWKNPTSGGISNDEVVCKYFQEIDSELYLNLVNKYHHDFKLFNYSSDKFYHCVKDFNKISKT